MASILIADDSDAIRLVLRDILEIGKHTVVGEAIDGADTIEKYPQLKPDLLLLDLAMPKKRWTNCDPRSNENGPEGKNNFDYCSR